MKRPRPRGRYRPDEPSTRLSRRVQAQLRLALLAGGGGDDPGLEEAARAAGLTGAEIDAARAGRSFEARTSVLLAIARAIGSGDGTALAVAQALASRIGLTAREVEAIASEVATILRRAPD